MRGHDEQQRAEQEQSADRHTALLDEVAPPRRGVVGLDNESGRAKKGRRFGPAKGS